MASTAKRLGEDKFFSEAFGVFRHISAIFRVFCLVVKKNFVYLHTVKGVATICSPYYVNVNKPKMLRNALKLNSLSRALRKGFMLRGLACVHTIELSAHLSARRRYNFLYLMKEILNSRISLKYSPVDIRWVIEDNLW